MPNQFLYLRKLKLNYKIILIVVASLILLTVFLTQKKIFFFLIATAVSIGVSLVIGLFGPLKIVGLELVTFSTILVGSLFGSTVAAIFGVCLFIIHIFAARYSGGPYIIWVIPTYALIGILSGFLTDVRFLVAMVIGVNVLDLALTSALYKSNLGKTLIFCIGNVIFNTFLILNLFKLLTNLI